MTFAFSTKIQMISSASFGRKSECIMQCRGELRKCDRKRAEARNSQPLHPWHHHLENKNLFSICHHDHCFQFSQNAVLFFESIIYCIRFCFVSFITVLKSFFRRRGLRDTTSVPLHLIDLRNVVSEKNIFKDGSTVFVCCRSCCCLQVWRIDVRISS